MRRTSKRDIFEPVAGGPGASTRISGDAEVKVAAEGAGVHLAHEVPPRRGDDAHVYRAVRVRAYGLDPLLGQDTKELGLNVDGELAELVEKERPAVGFGRRARCALSTAARERAALVAKQGALRQRHRDGAAVDDDERLGRAVAGLVDRLCHELLAGPRLARDEDGGGPVGEAFFSRSKTVRMPLLCPASGPKPLASGRSISRGKVGV